MTATGQNKNQPSSTREVGDWQTHRIVSVFIALIMLIAFFPLLRTGYTVPDDFQFALWANSADRWKNAWEAAEQTGRFQVFFHICLAYVPYIFDSHTYLKFVQIGSIVLAAWLFSHTLGRYQGDRHFGLMILLLFATMMPNMWEHHLFAAYPFVFQFGLSCLALSFLAFQKTLTGENRSSDRWQAGISLFLALLAYETIALYGSIFLLLAWTHKRKYGWRAVLAAMAPVLIGIGVFAVLYLAWRWQHPTNYAGARVDSGSLEWQRIQKVIWQFSWASFPGYVLTHFTEIHRAFPVSPNGFRRNFAALLQNMQVEWLLKAILVGLSIWLAQFVKATRLTKWRFVGLMLVGILLVFLPALPLSLTPKYQTWVNTFNVKAYVVTYFSYFGIVLFLATLATAIGQISRDGGTPRRIFVGAAAIVVMFLSLLTDYGNAAMHRSQSLEAWKWTMFNQLVNSPDFQTVSGGDCVLLDGGLTEGLAFAFAPIDYWQKLILQRTGKQVTVFDDRVVFKQCMVANNKPGFFIRYRQEANVANQFISLARVLNDEKGHLIGNQAIVYSLGHSRKFLLTWLTPGSAHETIAEIDGKSVAGQGEFSAFQVDKSKQYWGTLRTEIRVQNLAIDSIGINFFVENTPRP